MVCVLLAVVVRVVVEVRLGLLVYVGVAVEVRVVVVVRLGLLVYVGVAVEVRVVVEVRLGLLVYVGVAVEVNVVVELVVLVRVRVGLLVEVIVSVGEADDVGDPVQTNRMVIPRKYTRVSVHTQRQKKHTAAEEGTLNDFSSGTCTDYDFCNY